MEAVSALSALPDDLQQCVMSHTHLSTLRTLQGVSRAMRVASHAVRRSPAWRDEHQVEVKLENWMNGRFTPRKLDIPEGACPGAYSPTSCGLTAVVMCGGYLASAGCGPVAQVWQATSRQLGPYKHLHSLSHGDDEVTCLALRPGGRQSSDPQQIATACRGGALFLWDLPSGAIVHEFSSGGAADDEGGALVNDIFGIVWTEPDVLLSGGARELHRWSATSGSRLSVKDDCQSVVSLAYDPELDLVASPQVDFSVWLLAADSLECKHVMVGHTRPVLAVAIGGGRVASAGCGGSIRIWDAHTGACTATLCVQLARGQRPAVCALAIRDDVLVSGACGEMCVRMWRLSESDDRSDDGGGRVVARLHRPTGGSRLTSVCALAFDGDRVASGDTAASIPALWEVEQLPATSACDAPPVECA